MTASPALPATTGSWGRIVGQRFGRGAATYDAEARLQRAIAERLGRLCAALPLPGGPCADLGAGSGLLSRALVRHHPLLARRPPLQLDLCPELLARNPLAAGPAGLVWDLNDGLPPRLRGAALLASSFALQWLEDPAGQLAHWGRRLAPGGWLVLAVPTAGSFPQWHRAAAAAGVPCTALPLPAAEALLAAAREAGLSLRQGRRLRFTHPRHGGRATLRHLRRLGAGARPGGPLSSAELRRLLRHWPESTPLTWEVLLLLARRPG